MLLASLSRKGKSDQRAANACRRKSIPSGLTLGLTQGLTRGRAAVWNNGIHPNGDFKTHRLIAMRFE
ncbi:hypothetical protein MES5069_440129 [Mesorhizobium escarrei]|uniref:Uncharacterized protein n=1 Tax=Mesorhizobium escarrei TaxID=666018 RepID=A0ABM9E6N5_9HYPH|nr:hypothetical protein MES5069_440129 [Mesorhizobium escarrei]